MTTGGAPIIDPLSFFAPTGVKVIEHPVAKRVKEEESQKENMGVKKTKIENDKEQGKPRRMPGLAPASLALIAPSSQPAALWVDKYRPRNVSELVGNGGLVSKFSMWIKQWKSSLTKEKAVLLSGPAGIGKSSTARLVCEAAGFAVLEFNASDTRSKQAIDELASGLSTNQVLFAGGDHKGSKSIGSNVAIVMDEVDGMAGSGDRGGSGALIQMIKKSKIPIICICNDRQDSKIRSLANHCLDLRFARPSCQEIANRALHIVRNEGGNLNKVIGMKELLQIAESNSCDMRQVVNHLQLISLSGKFGDTGGQKDESTDPFAVVKGLFTSAVARTWSYEKRNEVFFIDYDFIPLLVQQNYLRSVDKISDPRVLPAISKACEFISFSDTLGKAIHTDAHWALLPEYATLSTVAPSFACNHQLQFPEFPAWLGKQSSQGKHHRLFKELRSMLGPTSCCSSRNFKLSRYSDVLYEGLVGTLTASSDGIKNAIRMLDQLGVPKDSLFEVLSETRFPWQEDPYAKIDPKTKAAFTRNYKNGNHMLRSGSGPAPGLKSKKSYQLRNCDDDGAEEEDEQDVGEHEEEEEAQQQANPKKRN